MNLSEKCSAYTWSKNETYTEISPTNIARTIQTQNRIRKKNCLPHPMLHQLLHHQIIYKKPQNNFQSQINLSSNINKSSKALQAEP